MRLRGTTFQSTRSARSATTKSAHHRLDEFISIHALRKERDKVGAVYKMAGKISIHALRKERDR